MHPEPAGDRSPSGRELASNSGTLLLPGFTLDRKYRIERQLGKGGMGAVYLATHLGTSRTVALKVIVPEYAAHDEFIVRFRREATAAGRMRHPNVVNVTDFGVTDSAETRLAYLVMEYLDGQTLGDYQRQRGRMPLDQVLDVVDQIALALDAAHASGIVHRDLKPDNVWMESNWRGGYNVKVLDFGIAKMVSGVHEPLHDEVARMPLPAQDANVESDHTITLASTSAGPGEESEIKTTVGAIIGTPAYMSPEQCLGMPVDCRADIYSLALIAYELVVGKRPFEGVTVGELLKQQIETPVPSPRQFDREISKPVATALMRGLEKDPAARPISAGTLAALLRAVVEGEFSVLRKGKDTYQSYASVFTPLWLAVFLPLVPFLGAILLALPAVSKARLVPNAWLAIGFYAVGIGAWGFCAQMYKAVAALQLLEASSVGAFRPATSAVIRRLLRGLPALSRTQIASLSDLRPASFRDNQLWPVVWAVEGLTGRDAVKRSQELSRTVPAVSLTLIPRFYAPAFWAALLAPTAFALVPAGDVAHQLVAGRVFGWITVMYFLLLSRLYVLYGTAFPFLYGFAASCRGESGLPPLPAGGIRRERKRPARLRPSMFFWWSSPALLAGLLIVGLFRKVPTSFIAAVADDRAAVILRAIDSGQPVDAPTREGETALYSAARYGDIALMEALLDRGARPDQQQDAGHTPLMAAVFYRHANAAELLLSRGADANVRNKEGQTALIIAARNGDAGIANMLIRQGADVTLRDEHGESAADCAREERHPEIVALLNR